MSGFTAAFFALMFEDSFYDAAIAGDLVSGTARLFEAFMIAAGLSAGAIALGIALASSTAQIIRRVRITPR